MTFTPKGIVACLTEPTYFSKFCLSCVGTSMGWKGNIVYLILAMSHTLAIQSLPDSPPCSFLGTEEQIVETQGLHDPVLPSSIACCICLLRISRTPSRAVWDVSIRFQRIWNRLNSWVYFRGVCGQRGLAF